MWHSFAPELVETPGCQFPLSTLCIAKRPVVHSVLSRARQSPSVPSWTTAGLLHLVGFWFPPRDELGNPGLEPDRRLCAAPRVLLRNRVDCWLHFIKFGTSISLQSPPGLGAVLFGGRVHFAGFSLVARTPTCTLSERLIRCAERCLIVLMWWNAYWWLWVVLEPPSRGSVWGHTTACAAG